MTHEADSTRPDAEKLALFGLEIVRAIGGTPHALIAAHETIELRSGRGTLRLFVVREEQLEILHSVSAIAEAMENEERLADTAGARERAREQWSSAFEEALSAWVGHG